MATYYWRGGAGTWDATTTTNWSTTSGGLGGAGPPTSADNVIFNNLSNATAYAVTIGTNAVAADITIAGPATGNVTITSAATSVINCYGSWSSTATGITFTTTTGAAINFLATTTGKTVTTNNVTLGAMAITFNGVGGGWTLGSAFTHTNVITVTNGAFSTGNFNIGSGGFSSSNSNTRTVTLGSSTLTITGTAAWTFTTTTNLTFSAGTSTITCSGASPSFLGGGLTYSTVSFTSTATGTTTITGANSFTTLSQATVAAAGLRFVSLAADQTVSGTLTLSNGAAANRRMFVNSSVTGTPRTLTVATLTALVDVDFQDTIAAGASSPWSGTRLGNCLGNTNITFGAGANKYFRSVSGASANWSGTVWSTSSADTATPAVNDFPLAQDTAIIDNAGATVNNGLRTGNTVTIDASWNMGTLSFSGRTVAFNWTQANQDPIIYGNVTLTSSMTMTTVSGTPTWTFSGAGLTQTLDSAGITLRLQNFVVDSLGGTVSLARDTTVELTALTLGFSTLTQGTLSLGSFTLTTVFFASSATSARTLAFGTGKIVVTANNATVCTTNTGTALTVTGSKRVELSYSGSVGTRAISGPTTATIVEGTNLLNYYVTAGTDIITFNGARGYGDIDFSNGGTSTFTTPGSFTNGTMRLYGNLILNSTMVVGSGANIVQFLATSGTKTITSATKTMDFPLNFNAPGGTYACSDALTLGATQPLTFANGTLQLAAGTTSTVGSFVTSGTTLKYLQSTTSGTQATISQASGTVTATYLSVQDSNATGGATWNATDPTNVYVTNNTGWNFGTLAALSGVAATGAVGSLAFNFNFAVTGVQATGSAGSVGFANAYALSSVLSTTAVDSVAPRFTVATTGVQATGAVGSVGFANAYILSGVQATGSVGSFGFANAYTLSGVQATGAVGNVYPGWYVIPTNQTPAWTGVSTTQTPSWTSVSTTQTPSWTNIIQS